MKPCAHTQPFCLNAVVFLLSSCWLILPPTATAQVSTAAAAINGTVTDSSGAVVPDATVILTNTQTGVRQTTKTNAAGQYVILDIPLGSYTVEVDKEGFATVKQATLTLAVNQTATFDFKLPVGSTRQTVNVAATAARIEASTAELGTAVESTEVNNLPLNGRNFTELLTLSPGVSPINTDQSGGGWLANPVGSFTFPAVNGQSNRSNMFLLDGVNNYGSFLSTYAVLPIVDDMEEFKVQSHNDEAQFGGVLGGIVNVVTKAGTNQFHGDAWEFLRNDSLDARNFFADQRTPLKQNQFGGAIGGPLILPGYNGRDKTFFFATYEGFRNHTASNSLYLVPTPAELAGDFSGVSDQIYNPFSTRPDPDNPGQFLRDPFPNNQIPTKLLDPGMVLFARSLYPAPVDTGVPGFNGRDTTPNVTRQDEASLRFDKQLRNNDRMFLRYTGLAQTSSSSGGFTGLLSDVFFHNYNLAVDWTHMFGGTAVAEFTFGRTSSQWNQVERFTNAAPNFWQQVGLAPNFASNFFFGRTLLPSMNIGGYLQGGEILQNFHTSDIYEYKGDFSKTHERHTLRMGAEFATNNVQFVPTCLYECFSSFETSNLETSQGGDALASFLLSVPENAFRGNEALTLHHNWVDGFYFQDQWKVSDRLTLNLGLRYDISLISAQGSKAENNVIQGDWDFNTGNYILTQPALACSPTQGAPCIPGGALPAHVVVSSQRDKIIHNTRDNIQPRVGIAYRLKPTIVLRASYGRFFDNWAGVTQTDTNTQGTWPALGGLGGNNLNPTLPTATAEDPLHLGSGPLIPSPNPFTNVTAFVDPLIKDAYSDQWNAGVQQELGLNTVVGVNYVGAHDSRLPIFIPYDVALTPGPGDPQDREPFPYVVPQPYSWSWGRSDYNALQVSLDKKSAGGLTYLIAYTFSKTIDIGCDGYFAGCGIQDPYHFDNDKSVAGFDLPHVFSASWVYPFPIGREKRFSTHNRAMDYVFGDWQVNGILRLSSGQPYDIHASGDIANTGNFFNPERANLVGNPAVPNPTPSEWFNIAAFVDPAPFTFGNLGRNSLRSDWAKNLDLSLFREFPITESKRLEFRLEAFNITNTPVFGIPDSTISDPTFGQVSSTANTERQLQFALKFYF
ncbi:MAG: TonB-dependent receptor domain-containing protein [Terriglobia bacterium]